MIYYVLSRISRKPIEPKKTSKRHGSSTPTSLDRGTWRLRRRSLTCQSWRSQPLRRRGWAPCQGGWRDWLNEISWDFGISWDYNWIVILIGFHGILMEVWLDWMGFSGISWHRMGYIYIVFQWPSAPMLLHCQLGTSWPTTFYMGSWATKVIFYGWYLADVFNGIQSVNHGLEQSMCISSANHVTRWNTRVWQQTWGFLIN